MTRYVEWNEPYDNEATANLICRLAVEDVIRVQCAHAFDVARHIYTSDDEAVLDFMAVHWGRIVEG